MDIDPRRLPFLLSVAREGGIVAAADILMVSPSAVSQQIQKLEEEVGLKLVERTTSGAILTPAGTIVAEAGERINADIAEALKALRPLTGQVTGTVTLGAFLTICRSTLIPALPDLEEALPGIDLRIEETEETPGMAALRTGRFGILVIERDEDPGLPPRGYTDIPFIDEPWVLVTPDSAPPIRSIEDLADLTWLRVSPGSSGDHVMRRITKAFPDTSWAPHLYTTYEAARSLVRALGPARAGSTILPAMALAGAHRTGMRITPLPSLGTRKILLRHKNHGWSEGGGPARVVSFLTEWQRHNSYATQAD